MAMNPSDGSADFSGFCCISTKVGLSLSAGDYDLIVSGATLMMRRVINGRLPPPVANSDIMAELFPTEPDGMTHGARMTVVTIALDPS